MVILGWDLEERKERKNHREIKRNGVPKRSNHVKIVMKDIMLEREVLDMEWCNNQQYQ